MRFHDFIEMLFGSKVKVMVLRTLWKHGGKEFTVRELAKFLGISHTGIKKVLDDLEAVNAIRVRTIGRSYAFKLNASSYAGGIVGKTFEMEREALSELRGALRQRLESAWVLSAVLFGSIADGRETSRSDIDLLVVTDRKAEVEKVVAELQKDVAERFGNSISVYYVGEEDLQKRREQSPIKQALQNHVLICGKPLE